MDVLIKRVALEMEEYRRNAKQEWGDKYNTRVQPYCALIVKEMRTRACSASEACFTFIGLLKPRGRLSEPVKAAIMSAALEVAERKMEETHPAPVPIDVDVTDRMEDASGNGS